MSVRSDSAPAPEAGWRQRYPAAQYVGPFAVLMLFIAARPHLGLPPEAEWPLQTIVLGVVCAICWPRNLPVTPRYWIASCAVGIAVFGLWIAPDLLVHGYRESVLFSNAILGKPMSSIPPDAQRSAWVLAWRAARATLVVPIAEELFWRGWLMRWLIRNDFEAVPLGAYAAGAFFITALLFAAEHGPYWDVGLITGIIYNLWMIRTKSVADCILMHAVTNGVLSAYVLASGNWQYWM